jgi:hypothetical protein
LPDFDDGTQANGEVGDEAGAKRAGGNLEGGPRDGERTAQRLLAAAPSRAQR